MQNGWIGAIPNDGSMIKAFLFKRTGHEPIENALKPLQTGFGMRAADQSQFLIEGLLEHTKNRAVEGGPGSCDLPRSLGPPSCPHETKAFRQF